MKKGFTLIELLAVILILGIIALIAIPSVTKIIDEARQMAFKSSVQGIYKAIENENGRGGFKVNEEYMFSNNKLEKTISEGEILNEKVEVDIKGTIDNGYGLGKIDNDGNITLAIQNGKYCAYNENGSKEFKIVNGNCGTLVHSSIWTDEACFTIDNEGTITGYDDSCGTSIVIPPTINNKQVKKIGEWAFVEDNDQIVAYVKNPYADDGSTYPMRLEDAIIGGYDYVSLDAIIEHEDDYIACYTDSGYIDIELGTPIDEHKCTYAYGYFVEYAGGYLENVDLSYLTDLTEIESYAFYNNYINKLNLNNLNNLKKIGISSFQYNMIENISLKNLSNLEYIGRYAFESNGEEGNIEIVNLPNLKIIDDYAFYYNYAYFNIKNLPKLEYIGESSFSFNNLINNDKFDLTNTNLKHIGKEAFYYTGIYEIKLPSSLEYIGMNAFDLSYIEYDIDLSNLTNLKSNIFNFIGENAYSNIILPPTLNLELASYSISSPFVESIVIPSNVSAIHEDAIYYDYNSSLTKIVNLTGKAFDFGLALGGESNIMETGTITIDERTIEIVNSVG